MESYMHVLRGEMLLETFAQTWLCVLDKEAIDTFYDGRSHWITLQSSLSVLECDVVVLWEVRPKKHDNLFELTRFIEVGDDNLVGWLEEVVAWMAGDFLWRWRQLERPERLRYALGRIRSVWWFLRLCVARKSATS